MPPVKTKSHPGKVNHYFLISYYLNEYREFPYVPLITQTLTFHDIITIDDAGL